MKCILTPRFYILNDFFLLFNPLLHTFFNRCQIENSNDINPDFLFYTRHEMTRLYSEKTFCTPSSLWSAQFLYFATKSHTSKLTNFPSLNINKSKCPFLASTNNAFQHPLILFLVGDSKKEQIFQPNKDTFSVLHVQTQKLVYFGRLILLPIKDEMRDYITCPYFSARNTVCYGE